MLKPGSFLRRHALWVGFLAVFVPLLILLSVQYWWLVNLEKTSAIARKATLNNYLEAVATKIEYFYRTTAEKTLNVPSYVFTEDRLDKAAYHFKKKRAEGAKRLFIYTFVSGEKYRPYFYDGSKIEMVSKSEPEEWRAVTAACAPWGVMSYKGTVFESVTLSVDEMDLDNRIVLNPITDDSSHVVGVAGMIVDEQFFRKAVLPKAIEKSLPKFFNCTDYENLIVTVRDGKRGLAFATGDVQEKADEVVRPIPFIFTDWRLGLQSRYSTPEQWARTNFAFNITLSILLAVVLISGIILALRTASRAIHLSKMKSDFVSNVSHELRTPLSSIRVFGEFLRLGRARTQHKIQAYGEYIETESRRLTQLINNILDFSKIESGQKIYKFKSTNVAEIVEDTLKTFEVRLKHAGFRINVERDADLPQARIDADAIRQAFNNLVDNAVKYSGSSKDIGVRLSHENGYVVVSVKDNGVGIPKEDQQKIFDRFHRVSTGLVHDVKGSGLGLSIVSHIVNAHGGRVTVQSEPGKGSIFAIHLPIDPKLSTAGEARPPVPAVAESGSE